MGASDPAAAQRRAAAARAAEQVRDGMVLGFGTGRAAGHALEALAGRMRQGLRIAGVASSRATEQKARALGLPLTTLDDHPALDLTIDGADEVDPHLNVLKGGGGALLREKVLAAASARLLIVVEAAKLVPHLGATRGIPLEVLPFAWAACARHLERIGGAPRLRRQSDGAAAVTDNSNWVIDCAFPADRLADPGALDRQVRAIPGVLETGLFWSFSPTVFVGEPAGVRLLERA
jgi:ribose 5-phosphate isomerase A